MSAFLDIAFACLARGWHVFPCWPQSKEPMTHHGHLDASNDEAIVRAWWAKTPDANVAIATGPSGLTVLDLDVGFVDEQEVRKFIRKHNITETYAVRTGKRPEFRVQLYYSRPQMPQVNGWS